VKVHQERRLKIPLEEIRSLVSRELGIDLSGVEPSIEGDFLVFEVGLQSDPPSPILKPRATPATKGTRRRVRRRNRIKTKGWNVVSKITNSQGLVANVYEPFVDALREANVSRSEQRKLVRQLLIRNRNHPSEKSVEYFLNNTLEYLRDQAKQSKEPS